MGLGDGAPANIDTIFRDAPLQSDDGPPIALTEADLQYFEQFCDVDSYAFERSDLRHDQWRDQHLAPPESAVMPAARDEWLRIRPRWTEPGWFDAPLRRDVQSLLMCPLGPALVQALAVLPVDGTCPEHSCPSPASPSSIDALSAGRPTRAGRPGRPQEHRAGGSGAPCACIIVVAAAWAAVTSWTEARGTRAITAVTGLAVVEIPIDPHHPLRGSMVDPAIEEIAPGLRCSPRSAQARVASSRALMDNPRLITAVESGLMSAWAARLVTTDLMALTTVERDLVVQTLIEKLSARADRGLRNWTTTELRAATKRLALAIGFDLRRARRVARRGRRVIVQDTGLGMASLVADLPADVAHRIYRRLTEIARNQPTDGSRGRDQQRADALADLILEPLPPLSGAVVPPPAPSMPASSMPASSMPASSTSASPPAGPASPPAAPASPPAGEVGVIVDLPTLLGLADNPGVIPGLGPIDSDTARELAADRRWRLWILRSAEGPIVSTSTRTYRPPEALARLIRARDPYCRMPGCRTPAADCDMDHATPWPHGPTAAHNLGPLCRRHHRLKTHFGWALSTSHEDCDSYDDSPRINWRSPAGCTSTDEVDDPLA